MLFVCLQGIVLPREEKQKFRPFYSFQRHDPESDHFYKLWRVTFLWFLKKVRKCLLLSEGY